MKREEYRKYQQKYNKGMNNSVYINESNKYYKHVEKKTISNVGLINNSKNKQYISYTNKNNLSKYDNNKSQRANSISKNQKSLNNTFSSKEKYTYEGKVRGKNNYVYYVSGVGYVTKDEEYKNVGRLTKAIPPPKPKPNPIIRTNQIKIQQTKSKENDKKELVDNYQYYESKDLKKDNKKTQVTHIRLCEPVYTVVNHRNSKKYSSRTEQPKIINKSFQRKEYEIVESRKPIKQTVNNTINHRTENISRDNKNKYYSHKERSYSSRNFNNTNENIRQNSYQMSQTNNIKTGYTNYIIKRKDNNENKRTNYTNNTRSGAAQNYNYKNIEKKNYEIKNTNRDYTNYNNIQKHEIKALSKNKQIKNSGNNSKVNTILVETKKYIPKVSRITRDEPTKPRQEYNNINYNINRRNHYETITKEKNQKTNNTYNNSSNINTKKFEIYEHNRQYYPLEPVKQIEHIYEIKNGEYIPQQMEQISIYEDNRRNRRNLNIQNIPTNIQIENRQISQNIPQQIQEIEVHEKKENIPQHVQQIEIYDVNKNEENIPNNSNIEEDYTDQNNEQQEEIKQEEEIYQENQEEENKEIDENIKNEQNIEKMEQNEEEVEKEEKEGNLQKEINIQSDEKTDEENKNNEIQMQQIDYDQYIPEQQMEQYIPNQENMIQNEEIYQINQRQYYNNNIFNNEQQQNYVNFCPIHGIIHNPVNQNIIFDMHGHYHQNRNMYNLNAEIGEDGMFIGDTNNYKFYESKNIKNEGEVKSMTSHQLRCEDKSNKNNNQESNVYVATKVYPIITDSNYSNTEVFHNENETNKTIENTQIKNENNNCPIHDEQNIEDQK